MLITLLKKFLSVTQFLINRVCVTAGGALLFQRSAAMIPVEVSELYRVALRPACSNKNAGAFSSSSKRLLQTSVQYTQTVIDHLFINLAHN